MNDIRRTILWVIFGFSMVLLWDQWQIHNGKKATFFPSPTQPASATAPAPVKPGQIRVYRMQWQLPRLWPVRFQHQHQRWPHP